MSNSQESNENEVGAKLPAEEVEDTTYDDELQDEMNEITSTSENLLRSMIQSYEDGYNHYNDKYEIKFQLTVTNHKVDTPDGKKDIAYMRLERGIKSKIAELSDPDKPEELKVPEWQWQLVHQEMHVFRSIQERLNPKAPWKEKLYLSCLYRLVGAGLEYAELLQKMKNTDLNDLRDQESKIEQIKKPDIIITDQMPAPMSKEDKEYQEWVKKNNEYATKQ